MSFCDGINRSSAAKQAAEKGRISAGIPEQPTAGAEQAAGKLNFSEGVKNGSRQDAPGTIREA